MEVSAKKVVAEVSAVGVQAMVEMADVEMGTVVNEVTRVCNVRMMAMFPSSSILSVPTIATRDDRTLAVISVVTRKTYPPVAFDDTAYDDVPYLYSNAPCYDCMP